MNFDIVVDPDTTPASQVALSGALANVFRGKFCTILLANRKPVSFSKGSVIYDVGDDGRTFFFLRTGFVKIGSITANGHEVIYDIRKSGDVIGELCACGQPRPDRAVALEPTEAIAVRYQEVVELLRNDGELLQIMLGSFCKALTDAYEHISTLSADDTLHRLVRVLLDLPAKLGSLSNGHSNGPSNHSSNHPSNHLVELPTYLTQEEVAQMVGARRERVSTALNSLRRDGAIHYSGPGRLVLNLDLLRHYLA